MIRVLCAAALALLLAGCASETYRDRAVAMQAVGFVDLDRYAGRWYEIARFPVWFQRGCTDVTADYGLREDGRVDVLNTCLRDGETVEAVAIARSVDASNAKLKVRFSQLVPIEGDYWVIHLDEDYTTAVVGVPSGGAGWILSRTPAIAPERLEAARAALVANGYDLARLAETSQSGP